MIPSSSGQASDRIKIAIVVGEASGDILGSGLMLALRKRFPLARFYGIGGDRMDELGFESWFPLDVLSVMGLVEVLRHLPRLFALKDTLVSRLGEGVDKPDLFIGIDAPDFNLRLERELHQRGIPIVHYVSPSVWAWRQNRIHGIRKHVDLMLTLLPFEAAFYEEHSVRVAFVGHPMADDIPLDVDRKAARSRLGLPERSSAPVLALLPGSRSSEVSTLMEVFINVARLLRRPYPEMQFLIPAANARRHAQIQALLGSGVEGCTVFEGQARDCMAAADVVVLASGTATLECMLLKRPMVVAYRLSPVSYWLMRLMLRTRWVALPNLLAREDLVPELLQHEANPGRIAHEVRRLLLPSARHGLTDRFDALHREIRRDASERAAAAIHSLLVDRGVLKP